MHRDKMLRLEGIEDEDLSPLETTEAPAIETNLDKADLRANIRDLKKFMHRRIKKDWAADMFDIFLTLALKRGADNVVMKRDVYPVITEKYGIKKTQQNNTMMQIRKLMRQFFEEEMGYRLTEKAKKKLKLSSADVITYEILRQRLAEWVLPHPELRRILASRR